MVQEQHPDRAQLYAAWKEFDFPILWDPFNTTESSVVPRATLIDAHGIVRKIGARPGDLESFLARTYPEPEEPAVLEATVKSRQSLPTGDRLSSRERSARIAMGKLLWRDPQAEVRAPDPTATLIGLARQAPENARAQFRAGVALRMRFDKHSSQDPNRSVRRTQAMGVTQSALDFQSALDHWTAALRLEPNQYIWRRRIQQYGPRLDKPYPFYTWIEEATADLLERGVRPPPLVAELTPAELMLPSAANSSPQDTPEPDPEGQILRGQDLVEATQAVAFHTDPSKGVAMVHLSLQPAQKRRVHWNNAVEPTLIWLDQASLPEGVQLDQHLLIGKQAKSETSTETQHFSFEVSLPKETEQLTVNGYALFYVCEGVDGACVYRRLDLHIPIAR